ncbi:MAG TPA: acetolactate synthase large subunit [Actinomycetota bacterium]|nr:acetolactate synthase large subunit [Actinomycetota bacterium]
MKITGAQAMVRSLEQEGVEVIFGIPGGAILPAYDPILDSPVRHILCRHEQGAAHAADGYAQATGEVGVCMATSGPGVTNLVTGLASAYMDSIPVVAISGQVPTWAVGGDAFQECDATGITMPITKHNFLVMDAQEIPQTIAEAFHIARTGRPGPVLVDIPKDVLQAEMAWWYPEEVDLPGYRPVTKGNPKQIREAAKLILSAKQPVIYAGGGIIRAGASDELRRLVELTGIPVVTTLMGRGAVPDDHDLCLGMPGMHGNYTAVTAMQKTDLLVSLGVRFDDRVTGKLATFAPNAKVIHADIDPAEIGKNRGVDVPIVGDARSVIHELNEVIEAMIEERGKPEYGEWTKTVKGWKKKYPYRYTQTSDGPLKPEYVIEQIGKITGGDAIYVAGVGQHQMWASQYIRFKRPNTWLNSGGLGTMGYAVPAAMGAKVGRPDEQVWAIDGDGCFQMTCQELATMTTENIPVKIGIINNAFLGMVRQWQELFYDKRFSAVEFGYDVPDYVKLAEAYGAVGLRCESAGEVEATIRKANEIDDRTVVIDFRCDPEEKCYPMVPAGASNDDIILGPEYEKEHADILVDTPEAII